MKYPFTTEGVQAFNAHLQTLNEAALKQQADMAMANFKDWLNATFELSAAQLAFIEALHPTFLSTASLQTAIAIENRLPISLIKPSDKNRAPELRGSKLIRDKSSVQAQADGEGNYSAEGELVYEISYD